MPDHVHMLLSVPPKYSVSQIVGYIKGKSGNSSGPNLWGAEEELSRRQHFWARRMFRLTVGRDEERYEENTS